MRHGKSIAMTSNGTELSMSSDAIQDAVGDAVKDGKLIAGIFLTVEGYIAAQIFSHHSMEEIADILDTVAKSYRPMANRQTGHQSIPAKGTTINMEGELHTRRAHAIVIPAEAGIHGIDTCFRRACSRLERGV